MASRIIDYPLATPARLAYAVRVVGIGIAAGGGIGFLLALAASITVNEAFIDLWYEFDGDPFSRAFIPLLFVVLVIGLGIFGVADSVYNWKLGSQLAAHARDTPEDVPAQWQREFPARTTPLAGLLATLWTVCGAGLLLAIISGAIVADANASELPVALGVLLGSLITAVTVAVVAILTIRVAAARWPAITTSAAEVWNQASVSTAARAEKARRPHRREQIDLGRGYQALSRLINRGRTIGLAVLLVGAGTGMLGVAIRQPCKRCDKRTYGSTGEAIVDNLAIIGASIAVLGILVLVGVALAKLASTLLATRALRQHLDPSTDAGWFPPKALLLERLVGRSLAESSAIVGAGAGAAAAATAISLTAVAAPVGDVLTDALLWGGVGVIALAGLIAYRGVGASLRLRGLLRARWAPGDVSAKPATRASRSRSR